MSIANNWKQPRWLTTTGEQIMVYLYNGKQHSSKSRTTQEWISKIAE